ncbi:MAG: hypothetical protein ACPG61_17135 [Paracoccaceae bacterium]
MTRWLLIGALVLALGLSGALSWALVARSSLIAANARLTLQRDACTARIANIKEDTKSDDEIDAMPDLRNIPDRWLRP